MITLEQVRVGMKVKLNRKHPSWIKYGCKETYMGEYCVGCKMKDNDVNGFCVRVIDSKKMGFLEMKCGGVYWEVILPSLSWIYNWKKL